MALRSICAARTLFRSSTHYVATFRFDAASSVMQEPHFHSSQTRNYVLFPGLKQKQHDSSKEIVLYERNKDRYKLTQTSWSLSLWHSTFWLYYSCIFLPGLEPETLATIEPMLLPVGVSMAFVVQTISIIYALKIVSKLTWRRDRRELILYKYSLPFFGHSNEPSAVYPLGELFVNPNSSQYKEIMDDLEGDITGFQGHLPLRRLKESIFSLRYWLDIQEPGDVREPEMLVASLLHAGDGEEEDEVDEDSYGRQRKYRRPRRGTLHEHFSERRRL